MRFATFAFAVTAAAAGFVRAAAPVEIVRTGDGTDDQRWYSETFAIEPNATYALGFEMKSDGGGGVAVTGTDALNVGFMDACKDWTPQKYVFRTLDGKASERLHFGEWRLKGSVAFRRQALEKVKPVHEQVAGMTLGAGEQIEGGVYRFTSRFCDFARNDSRPLVRATGVSFNSTRWCVGGGSEIVYRHAVAGRRFLSGTLNVGCCYRTKGEAAVEVSRDGRA